jgi:hypothetical protein
VTRGLRARLDHFVGCGWFWAWAIIGCGAVLATISLGPLFLAPIVLLGAAMASSARIRRSSFGLLTGAGGLFLVVAWIQRRGPGTVCWHTSRAAGCDSYLDPRPWLAVGILLVLAGIVGHALRRT